MGAFGTPEHLPEDNLTENPQQQNYGFGQQQFYGYEGPQRPRRKKYTWWQILLMILVGFLVFFIIMAIVGSNINSQENDNKGLSAGTPKTAPQNIEQYKAACASYKYKDIARNPNDYKGKSAKFTGKVAQIQENGLSVILRVNVTKGEYGMWDDAIFVEYTRNNENESRILEDDIITLYGELDGIKTYSAVLGNEVSIPLLKAHYVDIQGSDDSDSDNDLQSDNPNAITKGKYDKIKTGMSYEQVKEIIGTDGKVLSESGEKGEKYYMVIYEWEGNKIGSSANMTFLENKLETKLQYGLE